MIRKQLNIFKWAKDLNRYFSVDLQLAKEQMKKCSSSFTFRKMQIRTKRNHYKPLRISSPIMTVTSVGEDGEKLELAYKTMKQLAVW